MTSYVTQNIVTLRACHIVIINMNNFAFNLMQNAIIYGYADTITIYVLQYYQDLHRHNAVKNYTTQQQLSVNVLRI